MIGSALFWAIIIFGTIVNIGLGLILIHVSGRLAYEWTVLSHYLVEGEYYGLYCGVLGFIVFATLWILGSALCFPVVAILCMRTILRVLKYSRRDHRGVYVRD